MEYAAIRGISWKANEYYQAADFGGHDPLYEDHYFLAALMAWVSCVLIYVQPIKGFIQIKISGPSARASPRTNIGLANVERVWLIMSLSW